MERESEIRGKNVEDRRRGRVRMFERVERERVCERERERESGGERERLGRDREWVREPR